MAKYWCWERDDWGKWDISALKSHDAYLQAVRTVSHIKGIASVLSDADHVAAEARLLEEESIETSLIEGKVINRESVRASIAKKLGLGPITEMETRDVDGLIETLTDATRHYDQPLDDERLFRWQASLFPTGRDERGYPLEVGRYRTSPEPMKVVSISGRKEVVHYIAPPSKTVKKEMAAFLRWFNKTTNAGLMRAAIASYWFVSIHPFEDGNGRLSRAIADMAIAQAEQVPYRLYSLSETLKNNKTLSKGYYDLLEACSRGEKPIDDWVIFFLNALTESINRAEWVLNDILKKTQFWDRCRNVSMNDRQMKFMNWVLDKGSEFEGHIKRQRYSRVVGGISDATAKRDLIDLVEKEILVPIETRGRNAGYTIHPRRLAEDHSRGTDLAIHSGNVGATKNNEND